MFGILAGTVHSNLEIPALLSRFLCLYLWMVLAASASCIDVPAVLRQAIPEASPSLYFGMSLGLTFPFNILIGIPLYATAAARVLGSSPG